MTKLRYDTNEHYDTDESAWEPPCGCNDEGLCVFDRSKIGTDTGGSDWDNARRNPRYMRREKGSTSIRACIGPDEYMKLAAGFRGGRVQTEYESVSEDRTQKYAHMMREGTKFPVPVATLRFRTENWPTPCCLDTEAYRELEHTERGEKLRGQIHKVVASGCGKLRGSQEGRHRAMAAKALGVRRIPVFIEFPISGWTWDKGQTLDGVPRRRRRR